MLIFCLCENNSITRNLRRILLLEFVPEMTDRATMGVRVVSVVGFLIVILPGIFGCKYAKFTPQHSSCKTKNPTCNVFESGVTEEHKETILNLHNEYRSRIATGQEKAAGGMPKASNMLEMVWDDELAAIAQKHAEQCEFEHDCNECRRVDRFKVGQNIYISEASERPDDFEWEDVVKDFYDEVSSFNKKLISPFVPGLDYGHFTQLVWATSGRVGCGSVMYEEDGSYNSLYVCNYGPSGNIRKGEMYKIGEPCSSCPPNACCGNSCKNTDQDSYSGLCRSTE